MCGPQRHRAGAVSHSYSLQPEAPLVRVGTDAYCSREQATGRPGRVPIPLQVRRLTLSSCRSCLSRLRAASVRSSDLEQTSPCYRNRRASLGSQVRSSHQSRLIPQWRCAARQQHACGLRRAYRNETVVASVLQNTDPGQLNQLGQRMPAFSRPRCSVNTKLPVRVLSQGHAIVAEYPRPANRFPLPCGCRFSVPRHSGEQ